MSKRNQAAIINCNMLLNSKVLIVAALVCYVTRTSAVDFSTTNAETLGAFWAAAEKTNRPVTVVSFGDSMADSYRSVTHHIMNKLIARIGVSGYSMENYQNSTLWTPTNGAAEIQTGPYWFSQYFFLPAGSSLWWFNQANSGGIPSDTAGVFYVAQPAGGQFRLSISTNGGPWITKLLLDGYNPTPVGRYTNIALKPDNHRIRLDCEYGTNYIIGTQHFLSHTGGVNVTFVDYPGINLGQVTNVPLAIRQPIFAALNPDLIIWHMKEPPEGLYDRMEENERWWSNAAPSAAVIYIGTPWAYNDTIGTQTIDQNTIVRDIAVKYHRAYADLMQPTVSYSWLASQGFIPDGTHLTSAGALYCANIMWDDMGFFSIGLNKKISLTKIGSQINLSYNTSTGAVYRLETSTNLQTWSSVFTNPVGNTLFLTNFIPPTTPAYYRLGLRPL